MKALVLAGVMLLAIVAVAPAGVVEPASACYYIYTREDVGQLTVIRRSSCAAPEPYWCPYEGAPLNECDRLIG